MKKILITIVMVLAVGTMMAQKKEVAKLAKNAGVEYTKMSKSQIMDQFKSEGKVKMGSSNMDLLNIDFSEFEDDDKKAMEVVSTFLQDINCVHFVEAKDENGKKAINDAMDAMAQKLECIMQAQEDGESMRMYQSKKGAIGVMEDEESTEMLYIEGAFDLGKTMEKIAKTMQELIGGSDSDFEWTIGK